MFSSKIKTPCGRAVEIRNVVLLLLLLSPIVHAGSPTMFTGVELVRSNLPVGSGRRGCLCYLYPSGYIYNNKHRLSLCAARRSPLREVHDDVAISPHKSDRPPPGLRADKRKLDEPRTASLGGEGRCPAGSAILQRLSRPARRRYRCTAFSVFGEPAIGRAGGAARGRAGGRPRRAQRGRGGRAGAAGGEPH